MPLIRVEQRFERLARIDQRLHQASGVAEVDVLVDHPVDDEQLAAQPVDVGQGRPEPVPLRILLGRAHVFLGVGRVITLPERDGRPGHSHLENIRRRSQCHQGHIAAIAPAVDADSRDISESERLQPAHALDLIAHLDLAHAACDRCFECQSAPRRTAVVDLEDHEALLGQHLRSQVHGLRPAVVDHLGAWAAVERDDHGGAATLTLPRTRGREI